MKRYNTGRKAAPEWSEVLLKGENVMCKYCSQLVSRKIERIRNHLEKCRPKCVEMEKCLESTVIEIIEDEENPGKYFIF